MQYPSLTDFSAVLLSLYRRAHDLSPGEFADTLAGGQDEAQDALGEHVRQAVALNRQLHLGRLVGADPQRWGAAIASPGGDVQCEDGLFRRCADAEWPASPGHTLSRAMLEELSSAGSFAGARIVIEGAREAGLFSLRARMREDVDDLSIRELVVARLLARGLTHKEVAVALVRSPETIRSQSKVIFRKLRINSAVALPAKLAARA